MAAKKTSISLKPRDLERFRTAADNRGLSLSAFLARCADEALTPPDLTQDFAALAADLRADVNKSIARLAQTGALLAERDQNTSTDLREMLTGFLHSLHSQQVQTVKDAVEVGKRHGTQAAAKQRRDPTAADLGLRTPPSL